MSMVNNVLGLYKGKRIGIIEVLQAWENGWITTEEKDTILNTEVYYTLEEAKSFKKKELSAICSKTILNGIDIVLSDGQAHHFSLSEKDQINLAAKMLNVGLGVTQLEYHSDGEPCQYYSPEDMSLICMSAQSKVTFETTYYNCLTQWIKDCTKVEDVMAITYGSEVPEKYWSEPWRNILIEVANAQNAEQGEVTEGTEVSEEQTENVDTETVEESTDESQTVEETVTEEEVTTE